MGAHHLTDAKHTLSGYHASNSWSGCMRGFLCLVMALTGCVKTTSPTTTTAGMPPVEATQAWVLYESGLRHEDMVVGSGPMVQKGSIIKAHYIGRLTDGTMFDSSYERGQPLPLTVGAGQVIRGWDEGLVGMRMGGKRTLLIPPHLGYGSGGSGAIPPNSTLLFEVEVVEVTAPRSPAAAPAVVDATSMNQTESGLMWANLNDACDPIEHPVGARLAVEYDGFLESGRLFDSSRLREEPFSFALGMGRVIPGWDEGLADAPAGCKRQLVIPPHLGYGESGSRSVPPGATLTMDVEVVEVGAPRNPPMAPQSPSSFLTSPTGLQVAILSPGEGQAASGGDLVRVEYTGWLTDGSRFDSSLLRDRPIDILLGAGRVIAGWDEGLLGMRPGEVRQLVIPPGLGYGAAGKPPTIPPGATLVFEVQLVEILSSAP